jgi:hypothetical protein
VPEEETNMLSKSIARCVTAALIIVFSTISIHAQSDPSKDALVEAKLAAERGENNPTHYAQPTKIARVVRTVYICSQTELIPTADLIERMKNSDGFNDLDLVLVNDPNRADVIIVAKHIPWTFDYTAYAIDKKTTVHTADARVTAFNGYLAAIEISKELVGRLRQQRNAEVKQAR